jgi:hypothetical protein
MLGIFTGSARAELDRTSAGILRFPSRFLDWFACSVLKREVSILLGESTQIAYTVRRSIMVLMPYSSFNLFLSDNVASSEPVSKLLGSRIHRKATYQAELIETHVPRQHA